RDAPKARRLVEVNCFLLVNPSLQPQYSDSQFARVVRQVIQHRPAETAAAQLRTHVHALQLTIVSAIKLDAAAAHWHSILPHDEEGDTFAQQLVDAVPVAAFVGVQGREVAFELIYQRLSGGTIRAFFRGRHACETQNSLPSTSCMFVQT